MSKSDRVENSPGRIGPAGPFLRRTANVWLGLAVLYPTPGLEGQAEIPYERFVLDNGLTVIVTRTTRRPSWP